MGKAIDAHVTEKGNLAIRALMMPRDTNPMGSIFGGHVLSLVDIAAGQHARSISSQRFVTKVMREVEFISPVFVGDTVSFFTNTVKIGNTSVTVRVDVESQRGIESVESIHVTTAEVVMVAVNDLGEPVPIKKG